MKKWAQNDHIKNFVFKSHFWNLFYKIKGLSVRFEHPIYPKSWWHTISVVNYLQICSGVKSSTLSTSNWVQMRQRSRYYWLVLTRLGKDSCLRCSSVIQLWSLTIWTNFTPETEREFCVIYTLCHLHHLDLFHKNKKISKFSDHLRYMNFCVNFHSQTCLNWWWKIWIFFIKTKKNSTFSDH